MNTSSEPSQTGQGTAGAASSSDSAVSTSAAGGADAHKVDFALTPSVSDVQSDSRVEPSLPAPEMRDRLPDAENTEATIVADEVERAESSAVVPVLSDASAARKSTSPIRRPDWRFLFAHPAHWIALGFGSGLPWVMPGTFGTLFGWASYVVCMPHFTDAHWALSICLGFLLGVWACGVTGRHLGVSDHGSIVWDEIVAIWLVLWLVPQTVADQVAAFVLFRVIDIVKPQPIRYFDAKWKNGFGVMFDDLLAAFFTLLLFAMYYRFAGLPS